MVFRDKICLVRRFEVGGKSVKNFIPVMRAKRLLEMKSYVNKGYEIQDKKHYIMLQNVKLNYMNEWYEYGVQITQDEFYFYIIKDKANIYLSIIEIYRLLLDFNEIDSGYFVSCIKRQLRQKVSQRSEFICKDLPFKIAKPVEIKKEIRVNVSQTGIQITNKELFLLFLLIQEKSNALFKRSTGIKRSYVNGIFWLLVVLLEKNEDDELLEYLGWKWDVENNRFTFLRKSKRTGREMYKYYLTKSEYSDKISAKKS